MPGKKDKTAVAKQENNVVPAPPDEAALIHVFDEEEGKLVPRSPEQQKQAYALLNAFKTLEIMRGFILKRIRDNKHYLDFHVSSFKDFCAVHLDMTDRHARKYILIAERFSEAIPGLRLDGDASALLSGGGSANNGVRKTLDDAGKLGVMKLDIITRALTSDDLQELFGDKKQFVTKDGEVVTLEELEQMTAKEVTRRLIEDQTRARKKLNSKIHQLEETVKKLEQEKKLNERKYKDMKLVELKYGPGARALAEKQQYLEEASRYLVLFVKYFVKANVELEDPDELLIKMRDTLQMLEFHRMNLTHKYAPIAMAMDDAVTDVRPAKEFYQFTGDLEKKIELAARVAMTEKYGAEEMGDDALTREEADRILNESQSS